MNRIFRSFILISIFCYCFSGAAIQAQGFQNYGGNKRGFRRSGNRQNTNEQNLFDRFFSLDRDGNKILDSQEISLVKRPRAVQRLQKLDADSDGSISYQELVDFVISRRKDAVEKVENKIKKKLVKKIFQSSNPQEAEQNFAWLKSKKNIFTILDRDQNNKIDKSEIDAAMPDLLALVYSKRITRLSALINQSPSKQSDRRKRLIARLMDYNADDNISIAEFDRFLYRHVDKEVADQYALTDKVPNKKKSSEVSASRSNYIIESLQKKADKTRGKTGKKTTRSGSKPQRPKYQAKKKPVDKTNSKFDSKTPQKAENFIIPAVKTFEDEIEKDKDPLVDLLGAGADEDLLW
ncbi:MAG: hypothetical protein ACQETH_10070 [Candidatus Rifleibacteriota bacterium]